MNKPKLPQSETPNEVQVRDQFQTPRYATKLLVPFLPDGDFVVWEPAAGSGKIIKVLLEAGYEALGTDIKPPFVKVNFLTEVMQHEFDLIVTNPPFSLKKKFYERCREFGKPFALLIPADYSGWIIKAVQDGAEKIIPTRRIDYITPNGRSGKTSASQFHSMWLTWGLGIGCTETFVELTQKMKLDI